MRYLCSQVRCVLRRIRRARHGMRIVAICVLASALCGAARANGPITETPPEYVGPPTPYRAVTNRGFQGIPSIAVAPGGRLWATWYGGVTPGEDANNYVVLSTSGDNGKTWKEVLVVDPDREGPDERSIPNCGSLPRQTVVDLERRDLRRRLGRHPPLDDGILRSRFGRLAPETAGATRNRRRDDVQAADALDG